MIWESINFRLWPSNNFLSSTSDLELKLNIQQRALRYQSIKILIGFCAAQSLESRIRASVGLAMPLRLLELLRAWAKILMAIFNPFLNNNWLIALNHMETKAVISALLLTLWDMSLIMELLMENPTLTKQPSRSALNKAESSRFRAISSLILAMT